MRSRKEIQKDSDNTFGEFRTGIIVELLLDIRDLLTKDKDDLDITK